MPDDGWTMVIRTVFAEAQADCINGAADFTYRRNAIRTSCTAIKLNPLNTVAAFVSLVCQFRPRLSDSI